GVVCKPMAVQYGRFLQRALASDFGLSFRYREPAVGLVIERFPATITLVLVTLTIVIVVAVAVGVFSATRQDSPLDRIISLVTLAGPSVPTYWVAVVLVLLFPVLLPSLPPS